MPQRRRYKCLNLENCTGYKSVSKTPVFVAMNSPQPSCPHCGCIKLEDWGEHINIGVIGSEARSNIQRSDANLQAIAGRYGLTDMNNKDGQAVKRAAPPKPTPISGPPGQTINIGGHQVPLDVAAMGGCANMPSMAVPMTAEINKVAPKNSPMMKQMTRVVGEHKT